MSEDTDYDQLYDGMPIGNDLLVKAMLRVPSRPMRHAVTQSLSVDMQDKYKARLALMMADIELELENEELAKSEIIFTSDGRVFFKATNPGGPQPVNVPRAPRAQETPRRGTAHATPHERKLTPDGYVHVEEAGSRGGKFWRDEHGNVRYGEKPHGNFNVPAQPEHVVEHFRKYYAPQPFAAHNQQDLRAALEQSTVLSPTDHAFMEWWHDNYDEILKLIGTEKCTRKDVEKAGGLQNMTFNVGGRPLGIGEAIEEFFKANAENFVGDPQFGDLESPEDILEAVRGTMDRYRKALHEDPKVQAFAQAEAERRDVGKKAFYVQAEHMADEFSPLAGDMVTVEDHNDLAARFTVAMVQMGLIEKGGKSKVAKKGMRGAIVPKSALLLVDRRNMGSLWQEDQLDRLTAPQLMALHIASVTQDSFNNDNTFDYIPDAPNVMRDKVLGHLADKLGIGEDDIAKDTLKRKLEKTAEAACRAFTAYNSCQDPHFNEIFKLKVKDVAGAHNDVLKILQEKAAQEQARIEQILAAQEDDTFVCPPTMKDGVWNGKTLKNAEKPELGVWAPYKYQAKYVNWMLKVKRGVIAADAGMGKTPTVIMFREMLAHQGKDVPAICFLPPSLMEQWPAAVAKFAPDQEDKILNLSGLSLKERKRVLQSDLAKKAKYIFISTGTLTGDVPDPNADESENDGTGGSDHEMVNILKGLDGAVFIDEAHQGGYKKAGNTRHEIAKAVMADREYAFGMTATPMPNDPMDVYHLANLFAPGSVGDEDLWYGRTAGVAMDEETGEYKVSNPEHLADLNKRLKPFVFHKSLNDPDVLADTQKGLPEKQGVHESREMWPDEGDLELSKQKNSENGLSQHDYFKEDGVIDTMVKLRMTRLIKERNAKVERGEINPVTGEEYKEYPEHMLALMAGGMQISLQRQASISPALVDPTYRKADGGVAHSPKVKAICDDIVAHFANGGQGGADAKPLVVFCSFPGKAFPIVRKQLAERGVDPSLIEQISGEVNPSERGYMQDKLNKGHAKVLLVGTMSGGAGLNLQEAANKTLFLDEPWNPAAKRQAIGRVWRTGQKNVVHEKTYRSVGTYDSTVEAKIAGKQAMVHALLGKQLPTAETFSVKGSIRELLGRVKGTTFDESQIKAIMENSQKHDLTSSEQRHAESLIADWHSEGAKSWQNMAAEGGHSAGQKFTDEDYKPNKQAQEKLKSKGAHALTKTFDEKEFRAQWELDRDERRSKQNYEMSTLMAKMAKDEGDHEEADLYTKRAKDLAEKFPELTGGKPGSNKEAAAKRKKEDGDKKPSKSGKEPDAKAPKQSTLTATVGDAEAKQKAKAGLPKAETKKPANQMKGKEEEETPPPTPVPMAKPVKTNHALGVDFHTKENPFPDNNRKVSGTDITNSEASWLFNKMSKGRHANWDEFITKEVEPNWNDEDGRKPFSSKAAHEYVGKIVDAIANQGAVSLTDAVKPEKTATKKETEVRLRPGKHGPNASVEDNADYESKKAEHASYATKKNDTHQAHQKAADAHRKAHAAHTELGQDVTAKRHKEAAMHHDLRVAAHKGSGKHGPALNQKKKGK